jgi:hypothetical protein
MGWDASLPQLPYGPRFRKQRRLILDHFTRDVNSFRPTQRNEAYVLLRDILETPDAFLQHIRRSSGFRIPMRIYSRLTSRRKGLRQGLS